LANVKGLSRQNCSLTGRRICHYEESFFRKDDEAISSCVVRWSCIPIKEIIIGIKGDKKA
jgi:hypothetical protein